MDRQAEDNELDYFDVINPTMPRASEPYCDLCETEGHTFRTCPRRDDDG